MNMDSPAVILYTSLFAMIVSSVMALSPMEQTMSADIMSDFIDLQRKIMKFKMLQSSLGGAQNGNAILPAGLQNIMNSFGGMVPSDISSGQTALTGGVQSGSLMPEVQPSLGLQNPNPAAKTTKTKNANSAKAKSTSNAAMDMKSPSKQNPMADMLGGMPTAVGSTLEQNPMLGFDIASMLNPGSMMKPGQLTGTNLKGSSPLGSSGTPQGQAGMAMSQPSLMQMMMEEKVCSETPSLLKTPCVSNKDCQHNMKCSKVFTQCCAKTLLAAEALDTMVDRMEKQRKLMALGNLAGR